MGKHVADVVLGFRFRPFPRTTQRRPPWKMMPSTCMSHSSPPVRSMVNSCGCTRYSTTWLPPALWLRCRPAWAGPALAHAAVILHLAGSPDGIRRPIIRRRVAVGVENLGLEVADKRFDFGAGIRAAEHGEIARQVLGQINGAGARGSGRALKKRVVGIDEKLAFVRPQKHRADGLLQPLRGRCAAECGARPPAARRI